MGTNGTAKGNGGKGSCVTCATRCDSIFSKLPPEQMAAYEAHRVINKYRKGQIIFYEGNLPTSLFCVSTGKVKLSKTGEHGKLQIVRIAKPGDVLGYRSLLLNEPYRATAETLEDAVVCVIQKVTFFDWLNQSLPLNRRLLERLARELGDAEQRLLELVDTPAPQRLARVLLTLSRRFGKANGKSVALEIPLTREEIGEIVGTAPETTIRMLSSFKDDGLVSLGRRRIVIQNEQKLTDLAQHGEGLAAHSVK